MHISVFELFKIGIGPSSSHTVGPMNAARRFAMQLDADGLLPRVTEVRVELFGSLGFTGKGHGSDLAVLLGLEGEDPRTVPIDAVATRVAHIRQTLKLQLLGKHEVRCAPDSIVFHRREKLPLHSNGMRFTALEGTSALAQRIYYSVGGGFVVNHEGVPEGATAAAVKVPYPFETGDDLLAVCNAYGLCISTVMLENEKAQRTESEVRAGLAEISEAMSACIARGCEREGILPGGLKVKRRAATLARRLRSESKSDPLSIIDWVNLWALAVNEENAAGGRVVTAPTNGAAGLVPAVLRYYDRFHQGTPDGRRTFLLTAAAIGALYKKNASISGAEVGCQGEVGVACSMAAAGLTAALGASNAQIENAAEIAMEHNLGLTCDPIGGLVQIPCIERNAMGSVKAINASRMALKSDGKHRVSLDKVIATMRATGRDMKDKYKETSRGGLAVNVIEC